MIWIVRAVLMFSLTALFSCAHVSSAPPPGTPSTKYFHVNEILVQVLDPIQVCQDAATLIMETGYTEGQARSMLVYHDPITSQATPDYVPYCISTIVQFSVKSNALIMSGVYTQRVVE